METSSHLLKSVKQDAGELSNISYSDNKNSEFPKTSYGHGLNFDQLNSSTEPTIKRKPGRPPKKYQRIPFSLSTLALDSVSPARSRFSLPSNYIGSFAKKHDDKFTTNSLSNNTYGRGKKTSVITGVVSKRRRMKSILKQSSSSQPMRNGIVNDVTSPVEKSIALTKADMSTSTSPNNSHDNSTAPYMDRNNNMNTSDSTNPNSLIHYQTPNKSDVSATRFISESSIIASSGISSHLQQIADRIISEMDIQTPLPTSTQTIAINSSRLSMAPSSYLTNSQEQHSHYPIVCSPSNYQSLGNFEANLLSRLLPQAEAAICASRAAGLSGPHLWTPQMVSAFVATLPGCNHLSNIFLENEIDGPALLCLEQQDLMLALNLRLGPAVKIFGAIRSFRRTMMSIPLSELSADHDVARAAVAECFKPNRDIVINQRISASYPFSLTMDNITSKTISNAEEQNDTRRLNGLPSLTDSTMSKSYE